MWGKALHGHYEVHGINTNLPDERGTDADDESGGQSGYGVLIFQEKIASIRKRKDGLWRYRASAGAGLNR